MPQPFIYLCIFLHDLFVELLFSRFCLVLFLYFSPFSLSTKQISFLNDQVSYKRWLWWTRFAVFVTALQFVVATYLVFTVVSYVSHNPKTTDCIIGKVDSFFAFVI